MSPARCLIPIAAAALASAVLTAAAQSLDIRVSEIIGRQVKTSEGELLTIRDLLIDPGTRRVEYVALSRAGGNGEEALPLYPVSGLRSGTGKEMLFVLPDAASAGSGPPLAYLPLSKLGRLDDMTVRLTDGTVSLAAPPPP
jgi:hypothetical protein